MVHASTVIPIDAMDFAQRLVALRKERGLTQQALADRVGIHVSNIRRYEAGTSQPTLDVLRNVALALATSADSLLFDEDERGPDDARLAFEATRALDDDEKEALKALLEGFSCATTPAGGRARLRPSFPSYQFISNTGSSPASMTKRSTLSRYRLGLWIGRTRGQTHTLAPFAGMERPSWVRRTRRCMRPTP